VTPMVGGGVCEDKWGDCTFSLGLPTFDINLLCNDLVFDFGFEVDCTCTYTCPQFPYYAAYPKTVGINLKEIMMRLNPEQYAGIFGQTDIGQIIASGGLMNYCRMDP